MGKKDKCLHQFCQHRVHDLYESHEAEPHQIIVNNISTKISIFREGVKDIHPILNTVFPQVSPPGFNPLVVGACSIQKTFWPRKNVIIVSAQKHLYLSHISIFGAHICTYPPWATTQFRNCIRIISQNHFRVFVGVEGLQPY